MGHHVKPFKLAAANLLLVDLERVSVLHLEGIRGICRLDALALKEEPHRDQSLALAFAKGSHELLELGRSLDFEEHLVIVVCHLDVEVLGARTTSGPRGRRALVWLVGASRCAVLRVVCHRVVFGGRLNGPSCLAVCAWAVRW